MGIGLEVRATESKFSLLLPRPRSSVRAQRVPRLHHNTSTAGIATWSFRRCID